MARKIGEKILEVNNLTVSFKTDNGLVRAVRGVSFDLSAGETLCIVGESGSGKSVTSKAIIGILSSNAVVEDGQILYRGENLLEISEEEFHKIRGNRIGMIFQDPLSSLNPIVRIGKQITEAMLINSNKLKQMYDQLIERELIAYKNCLTKRKIYIEREKTKYESLENEVNTKLKNRLSLKQQEELKAKLETLDPNNPDQKDTYREIEASLNENILTDLEVDSMKESVKEAKKLMLKNINDINEEAKKLLPDLKAKLSIKKKEAKEQIKAYKEKCVAEHKLTKAEADKKLSEAKQEILPLYKEQLLKNKELLKERKNEISLDTKEYKKAYATFKTTGKATYNGEEVVSMSVLERDYDKRHKDFLDAYDEYAKELEAKAIEVRKPLTDAEAACEKEYDDYIGHLKLTRKEAKRRALKIMEEVGIPFPEKRFRQYPFEFSGGMRQRIVIAIALTATPEILICDEPTTALDVTIQAQILELIKKIQAERNIACIFITHDLGVVANMADRVAVMYAGKIVEYGNVDEIFYEPKHPYTWALLSSIPDVDSKERLEAIPGTPPNMIYPPKGDAFALRSKYAMKIDFEAQPPFFKVSDTHYAATWLLHPDAPKVEMPRIVSERIKNALKKANKEVPSNE